MSIDLQVAITVKKLDSTGAPTGDPVYCSESKIHADTGCALDKYRISGGGAKTFVNMELGQLKMLRFLGVKAARPEGDDSKAPIEGLTFMTSNAHCEPPAKAAESYKYSMPFELSDQVAYWGEALDQLYKTDDGCSLDDVHSLVFTNPGCDIDVTIYVVRNVGVKKADPCKSK